MGQKVRWRTTLADFYYHTKTILQHELHSVAIYVTDRCNSRCKHCFIWNKPKIDLPLETIDKLLHDPLMNPRKVSLGLQGGEFFDHPQWEEILKKVQGYRFTLLSNCMHPEWVIEAVRKYKPIQLDVSLDGAPESFKRVRGIDYYDDVLQVIKTLHKECKIQANYVITPWNTREDLQHVKKVCDGYEIILLTTQYNAPEHFETHHEMQEGYEYKDIVGEDDYLELYNGWLAGQVKLPCYSIRRSATIYPDGRVSLCQGKEIILGNLFEKPFSKIWASKEARELRRQYRDCNGCWLICQRPLDIHAMKTYERLFPKWLLEKFVGRYSWGSPEKPKKHLERAA